MAMQQGAGGGLQESVRDSLPESREEVDRTLARRAVPALFIYPLALLILGFSAAGRWPDPLPFYALTAVLVLLVAPRFVLLRRFDRVYPRMRGSWRRWHRVSMLVSVAAWSLICAWTLISFGVGETAFLALLISALLSGNVIVSQAPDLLLVRTYVAVTLLVPVAALAYLGRPTPAWIAVTLVIYGVYLMAQSGRLHREFDRSVADRTLLAQRAGELEEARDARQQDYRRIFENAHDAILVFDPLEERVLAVNRRACEVYGFERSEFVGMSLLSISKKPLSGRQQIERTLAEEPRRGFHSFETTQYRKDGSEILVEVNASIVEHRGAKAILSINRDITERRRTEELRVAKEAAERADRAKGEFLARMSHEVRTPMSGIMGVAELLLRSELPPKSREYAAVVRASAEGLLRVVNDILDLSKLEAGELSIENAPFDLSAVVAEVAELLEPRAAEAGIELRTEVCDELPPALIGDSARLRQVLLNVVGNALKFTLEGHVEVRVDKLDGDGPVQIVVADTGIGIAPEDQEQVFAPYQQACSGSGRRFGGTGLGLAICRHLVTRMGGSIDLESTLGAGTTVRITLELEAAAESSPEPAVAPSPGRRAPRRGRHRILVADDNPTNRLITQEQLKHLGYHADVVSDGYEVLEALAERPCDLVLMDCQMPGIDGYETTRRIRGLDGAAADVPVIAHTASAMKGDRERCLAAGMQDYISKPYAIEELAAILERWLASRRSKPRTSTAAGPSETAAREIET